MNIRNRITLWITAAGLLAGLLFSLVISYEIIEQPYELLDSELYSQAHTLLIGLDPRDGLLARESEKDMLDSIGRLYWFKLFNQDHKLLYASTMTGFADLPLKRKEGGYNISSNIPWQVASLEQDDSGEVTFRVRVFAIDFGGHRYLIQIARPMERLDEEINDLIVSVVVGLVVFTIALVLLGYYAAGKILQPIGAINTLAMEINDKTLDKRIPLGKTQDELYSLSSSLNQMFDRLQFSFLRQKELLANASHELKTPLSMLRLFFDESLQRDDIPQKFKERLGSQSEILLRMDRLVKNLLDLSILEMLRTLRWQRVDLTAMIHQVITDFEDLIQLSGIRLVVQVEKNVELAGDEDKLRRMLINLIDNAVKYTFQENGEIRFTLTTREENAHIEIYNSGRGIPKADIKRVFEQFYRVEKSRSSALGGTGLGLSIVRRIIELHHGSVSIESEPESWVRIDIILPLTDPDAKVS